MTTSVDETSVFVRRGSEITALGVADILESAIFYASDDSDATSAPARSRTAVHASVVAPLV